MGALIVCGQMNADFTKLTYTEGPHYNQKFCQSTIMFEPDQRPISAVKPEREDFQELEM